jgi:hypothetical protein
MAEAARTHRWGSRVVVAQSGYNGGYGFAINAAARIALTWPDPPRYLHALNSDATPLPGSLTRFIEFMDAHPQAGLAGSVVHSVRGSTVYAFRFPSARGELEGNAQLGLVTRLLGDHAVSLPAMDQDTQVAWVPGTSVVIRAQAFLDCGGFDEDFFLYFEEIDLCRRLREKGWSVHFVAGAGVHHLGSLATGMTDTSTRMPAYWFAARRRYWVKHHGRAHAAFGDAMAVAGLGIALLTHGLKRTPVAHRPGLILDQTLYTLKHLLDPAPVSAAPKPRPATITTTVADTGA